MGEQSILGTINFVMIIVLIILILLIFGPEFRPLIDLLVKWITGMVKK